MTFNWLELQTIGGLVVGVPSILYVSFQLRETRVHSAIATRAMRSDLYSHVSEAMDRVNSRMAAQPNLIPYFYDNVRVPGDDIAVSRQCDLLSEIIMDMVDSVVEQRRAMPEEMDWSSWYFYFRWLHNSSWALRRFLDENADFYPDYAFAALGRITVRDRPRGTVLQRWQAWEASGEPAESVHIRKWLDLEYLPSPGYPWVRTWLFAPVSPDRPSPDQFAVIADVEVQQGRRQHEDTATVRLAVTDEDAVGPATQDAIGDWILRTFERTGIRWARLRMQTEPGPGSAHPADDWIDLARRGLYGPHDSGRQGPTGQRPAWGHAHHRSDDRRGRH